MLYCWAMDEAARMPPEKYKSGMSKVEASLEGLLSDSSLISASESPLLSDTATPCQAPDASLHA